MCERGDHCTWFNNDKIAEKVMESTLKTKEKEYRKEGMECRVTTGGSDRWHFQTAVSPRGVCEGQ